MKEGTYDCKTCEYRNKAVPLEAQFCNYCLKKVINSWDWQQQKRKARQDKARLLKAIKGEAE